MADKLSWTDLRRVLATRAGVNEKQAAAFLNAIQSQLVEALKNDKQVKINGLGTFKVQAVAPRKSVNVNTGEEIMIEGYCKLVFAPEAGVKELVEKSVLSSAEPTAESEQPKEIDPLKKLGAQAEEIVDILGDLGIHTHQDTVTCKAQHRGNSTVLNIIYIILGRTTVAIDTLCLCLQQDILLVGTHDIAINMRQL